MDQPVVSFHFFSFLKILHLTCRNSSCILIPISALHTAHSDISSLYVTFIQHHMTDLYQDIIVDKKIFDMSQMPI